MVQFPAIDDAVLTMGETGWKASAFEEPIASEGRRLSRALTRSLRTLAPVPVHAVSYDGASRGARPAAWASQEALVSGRVLRQFREGAVWFAP